MRGCTRIVVVGLLAALNGCGNSSTAPSDQLALTGTWSGLYGRPGSGSALRLTWSATHTGSAVSGMATLVKPVVGVQARGVLTGTLNGDRIALTYVVPTDSIPGFSSCSIIGAGNGTATNSSIAGQITLIFTSCAGTGLEPAESNDLLLTK
jgi:hypothetical protein